MEDLRLAIIVLGVFSILGILIHGLWTIRKNAVSSTPPSEHQRSHEAQQDELATHQDGQSESLNAFNADPEPQIDDPTMSITGVGSRAMPAFSSQSDATQKQQYNVSDIHIDDLHSDTYPHVPDINLNILKESDIQTDHGSDGNYDTDGIGQVRVVKQGSSSEKPYIAKKEPKNHNVEDDAQKTQETFPEPPSSLLKSHTTDDSVVAVKTTRLEPRQTTGGEASTPKSRDKVSLKERARQFVSGGDKPEKTANKRVEPKLNEEKIRIDFEQNELRNRHLGDNPLATKAEQHSVAEPIEQEVLVLNVKMPDDKHMSGAALLPALLTLGFKFGEQDVFHRHANSNGKGPKLFSLANMFKPGTFNLDNMEIFETQGVSLFMILPIEGEPQQVFNMMHNAARKLADEFGAHILDTRRSLLTKQSLQQYVEKIREFERKRMINKV